MISAREFCREPGYPITVFLSYSFDPLFFERIPLGDLDRGGSRRIVIAADANQVGDAMRRCMGQVVHLGRRYVLAEAVSTNTFHPKLIARLSSTGGRIWVGSGNLTYTGWGGNQELATAWSVGPEEEDKGEWLNEVFEAVSPLIRSSTFIAQLEAIRDSVPWLTASSNAPARRSVIIGMPDRPLAPQLAERWKDRRFSDLMLCTGSTDAEGAFLSWTHRTFGIKRAVICLNPAFASFDPARLAKLPFDIRIIKASTDKLMHAKFYWFSGPDGHAALVGSANCSAAAWLTGNGYGNAELIVAYDNAREAEFKTILKVFSGQKITPDKALLVKPSDNNPPNGIEPVSFRLASLRLRSTGRIIETIIEPSIPVDSQVYLVLSGASGSASVRLSRHADILTGRLPPEFHIGLATSYAFAEINSGADCFVTQPRWIDNEGALARASSEPFIDPSLRDFSRKSLMNADQQRILEAIYSVSSKLLRGDGTGLSKMLAEVKGPGRSSTDKPIEEDISRAVDPAAIVRSLRDLRAERKTQDHGHFSGYGGALDGVIAMLFSRDDEEEQIDLSREAWMGDDPEPISDDSDEIKGSPTQQPEEASANPAYFH